MTGIVWPIGPVLDLGETGQGVPTLDRREDQIEVADPTQADDLAALICKTF